MKKNIAVTPYMMPSFLWSTVKIHDFQPVVLTGRRNMPIDELLLTNVGWTGATPACRSRTVIRWSPYFRCFR